MLQTVLCRDSAEHCREFAGSSSRDNAKLSQLKIFQRVCRQLLQRYFAELLERECRYVADGSFRVFQSFCRASADMVLIVLCRDSAEQFAEFFAVMLQIILAEIMQRFCRAFAVMLQTVLCRDSAEPCREFADVQFKQR